MSANSSLSAAKRRRGGTQLATPPQSNMGSNEPKPPQKIPHPLDILKNHELRIRDLEKTNISLARQNEAILKQLKSIKKQERVDCVSGAHQSDNVPPTFSSLNISGGNKIEGSICEEESDTDSSNEN